MSSSSVRDGGKLTKKQRKKLKKQEKKSKKRRGSQKPIAARHTTDYNPYNAMQCPKLMQTPNKVTFQRSVDTIANNLQAYVTGYPFSGIHGDLDFGTLEKSVNGAPRFYAGRDISIGSNYFAHLGRTCSEDSVPECVGKPAEVYIRNIPSGKIPLLGDLSFRGLTGCNIDGLTEGRGLLPGMLEDISDISPMALVDAMAGKGNAGGSRCELREYPVGAHIYDRKMEGKSWQMEARCTPSIHHVKSTTDSSAFFTVPGAPSLFGSVAEEFASKQTRQIGGANRLPIFSRYWFVFLLLILVCFQVFFISKVSS